MIRPPTMAIAPTLIGFNDGGTFTPTLGRIINATVIPTPQIKLTQTEAFVIFFENKPYKNGARKEPAKAPQE